MTEIEIFKPIINFRNIKEIYEISQFGNLRNIKTQKFLKKIPATLSTEKTRFGYHPHWCYQLQTKNKKSENYYIYEIVFHFFVRTYTHHKYPYYIDDDINNYRYDNLRFSACEYYRHPKDLTWSKKTILNKDASEIFEEWKKTGYLYILN